MTVITTGAVKHGAAAYKNSLCRCDDCRVAARQQTLAWRQRNIDQGIPPPRHGLNGYNAYGCKCETCSAARSAYMREYMRDYRARNAS